MTEFNTADGITDMTELSSSQEQSSTDCGTCLERLCLREKLINLALGQTEIMYCVHCLAKKENVPPERLLAKIKSYIRSRQCFEKEWIKYIDVAHCPKPKNCLPAICFDK